MDEVPRRGDPGGLLHPADELHGQGAVDASAGGAAPHRADASRMAGAPHAAGAGGDLGGPAWDAAWPHGVEPRAFVPGDEEVFYDLHQETFRDTWEPIEETYDEWAHQFLVPEVLAPAHWTLAVAGDEPAGFAMCHPHAVDSGLGWVRVLGVRSRFRGRGLGRALLLHAFTEFRRQGLARAGLGVDSESPTGANKLYESVGMHVSARFAIHEKGAT